MNKLAFTFLSCSLLNCAFALDITKAKNSFAWHNNAITQKISCIERSELKTKFNSDKNSAPIARLIALTRLGLPQNATLQSLGISGLNDKYIELMQVNNIGNLANIIGKDKIQSWSINNENEAKKLNTFLGFACAINARTQNKTFSKTDIDETVDQTISKLNLSKFNSYRNTIKRNLWNAFNSWEIHALDHVLREEKNGVQNSRALTNAGNSCFFNASMQAVYACKPLREFIINDLKDNKDSFVADLRTFLDKMSSGTGAVETGSRGSNGKGLAYNVLKHIAKLAGDTPWSNTTNQEDSSEFLTHMIDKIHDAVQNNKELKEKFEKLIYSNVHSALEAKCAKKHTSKKTDQTNKIEIQIQDGRDIQTLFKRTLKEQEDIDDYKCENCGTRNGCKKTTYLTNPAKIIPISLKRFTQNLYGNISKDNAAITPNQILHVYDYINKKSYKYILNSVSVHSGGLDGGHYYAYQRVGNTWQEKNDRTARTLDNNIPDDAKNGYVFFYERLDEATF